MADAALTQSLRTSLAEQCTERQDFAPTLQTNCPSASVSRAVAYRGTPSFAARFDEVIAALHAARKGGEPLDV